ncbi:rhodanese-like domain-containing protein [Candidatus Saccharibacteria bacterium]|nr:rhodanese-like domain-containing protein [Candidatus Saccharibacteria bacterium]
METVFIDVREPFEYMTGHVKGALNIPPAKLVAGEPEVLKDLPRDTKLVVYCLSGSRSNASIPYLRQYGFTNIENGINKGHVKAKYL